MDDFGGFCALVVFIVIAAFPWIVGVFTILDWLACHRIVPV